MTIITRIPVGNIDVVSGILFIVGMVSLQNNTTIGLILIGIAILKQLSGK